MIKGKNKVGILLLGIAKSGKTSLLKSAPLILTDLKPIESIDCWVNENATFIDSSNDTCLQQPSFLKRQLRHIMLVIDLPNLLNLKKETLNQLTDQLHNIQTLKLIAPVTLIISQCDRLAGFHELFDDLSAAERKKQFGIQLPTKNDSKQSPVISFKEKFDILVNHLKNRRLKQLHHQATREKRERAFSFPDQLSQLGNAIEILINTLPFNETMPLKGVYFTATEKQRHYFIDQLIQSIATDAKKKFRPTTQYTTERLLAPPIAAGIIFLCTILWHIGCHQTVDLINKTQTILTTVVKKNPDHIPWLTELNALNYILEIINKKKIIHYQLVGLLQAKQLNNETEKVYKNILQTQFTPYLKSLLLKQIDLGLESNALVLFDALKTYLCITNPDYYDKDAIMSWYQTYWKALYPKNPEKQAQLQHHLFMLLKSNQTLWKSDQPLIKKAQNALQKLPLAELAFLELQGEYDLTMVPIFSNNHLEGISLKNATVPNFFSNDNFKDIFDHKIPEIGSILAKRNWVIGSKKGIFISKNQQTNLAKKIRKIYLSYYATAWAETIAEVRLKPAKNYSDVLQRIDLLLNKKSNLSRLLKIIMGNAHLDKNIKNKNLEAAQDFLDRKEKYNNIYQSLTELKNEINAIQKSKNSTQASYLKTAARFKKTNPKDLINQILIEAKNVPEPIRSWLQTIALSSWAVMLQQTRDYLNEIWRSIVLPVYYNEIENRYPIFINSHKDISLKNFTDFFGPKGAIGTYFVYYLQPFVNMSQNYWTWKNVNGMNLGISQKVLNTFIRASIIQQMFFTDKRDNPGFQFILLPLNIPNEIKKLAIDIDGQSYVVTPKAKAPKSFTWPGSETHSSSIKWLTINNKSQTTSYNGPWSWFRLINANTLQTTSDPKQFIFTIKIDNQLADFRVITTHRVNPMIPGVMGKYRCPEDL